MEKLVDRYGRKIDYLRISVTDRCNLRCIYCMPEYGIVHAHRWEILTFYEIEKVVKAGVKLGINKIRITGGEPLVRRDIVDLISILSDIEGIKDLSMTTNGIFLSEYSQSLQKAGLMRINISIDTLDEKKYKYITKMGNLNNVLESINKAQQIGLFPKVNVVLIKDLNDDEILDFVKFSYQTNICVRFIEFMPTDASLFWERKKFISNNEVKKLCEDFVTLDPIEEIGNGPGQYYKVKGTSGKIGFISPLSERFCNRCNRLRLTSTGKLKSCLRNEQEIDLRTSLRENASLGQICELIKRSVFNKPERHYMELMELNKQCQYHHAMCQIGG